MRTIIGAAIAASVFAAAPAHADTQCYSAEPIADGLSYHVRNAITSGGNALRFVSFTTTGGQSVDGKATARWRPVNNVPTKGFELAKIALRVESALAPNQVTVRYADFGGGVNLRINGEAVVAAHFGELDGRLIGGATVSVQQSQAGSTRVGTLRLTGALPVFAVGGQSLLLQEACGRY
jgi:hypothetical protein